MSLLDNLNSGLDEIKDIRKEINVLNQKRREKAKELEVLIPNFFTHDLSMRGAEVIFNITFYYKDKFADLSGDYIAINSSLSFLVDEKSIGYFVQKYTLKSGDPIGIISEIAEKSEGNAPRAIYSFATDVYTQTLDNFIKQSGQRLIENIETLSNDKDYLHCISKLKESDLIEPFKAQFNTKIEELVSILTLEDINKTQIVFDKNKISTAKAIVGLTEIRSKGLKSTLDTELSNQIKSTKSMKI